MNKLLKVESQKNFNIPLVEKYRPKELNDIIMDSFLEKKINLILETKDIPNIIFTGEPSTGKTSTALYLAKQLYKPENIIELNASDDRGLNMITNTIIPFCKKKSTGNKLVILDEADSITNKAQQFMDGILDTYKEKTRFIFICNEHNKINESLQSRCVIFNFCKLSLKKLTNRLKQICDMENIKYDSNGIRRLIFFSDDDIRQCLNNLECLKYTCNEVTIESIDNIIDVPKLDYIIKIFETKDLKQNIDIITKMYNKGYSSNDIMLVFMKYIQSELCTELKKEVKFDLYKIMCQYYIKINDGNDSLLQLISFICELYNYIKK